MKYEKKIIYEEEYIGMKFQVEQESSLMKCVNEKLGNNRSTEWELNVKFEITTIYFLKVLYVNYQ